MKFLIDNNLSYKLAGNFSADFPDSAHVRTVLSVQADDRKIWRYAGRNSYVILTKDNDLAHKKEILDFGTSDPESCLLKILG